MKHYLSGLLLSAIVLLASCYKAKTNYPKQGPPVFDTYLYSNGEVQKLDSSVHILGQYFSQNDLFLDFRLVAGTPTDYQFEAYFTDLPLGVTCSFDTLTFKLNYHREFTINAPNFYGVQTAYLHVSNPTLGTKTYPLSLHGQ